MVLSKKTKIWVGSIFVILIIATLLYFYWLYNPMQTRWAPKCVFKAVTGWSCPGCGGQRALYALLHGHIWQALSYNPLWIILIPYALLLSYLRIFGGDKYFPKLANALDGNIAIIIFCSVIVLYTIIRNIYHF